MDSLIAEFDRALRAITGLTRGTRASPAAQTPEAEMDEQARAHAAALMRVNHVGEICAQALYSGQSLTARDARARAALEQAAREEADHLAWCSERVHELGGRLSLLNPAWYAGSLAIGLLAGALGDRWNMAFLAETERQVEEHLTGHLDVLPAEDSKTRAIVAAMRIDEARHGATALRHGTAELPEPVKRAMQLASRVMTTVAYRI